MPILIEVNKDAPLNQGDILKDVSLFRTGGDWTQQGGQPQEIKPPICMVLSRPCVATRKPYIVVAAVERIKEGIPKGVETFEKVKRWLEKLRDGFNSLDRFYLGQEIPTLADTGRFFARLDSLCTVELPKADTLVDLLSSNRVATLDDTFRHDLHRRILSAFSAMGFDDYGWFSNQDLDWLIAVGNGESSELKSQIEQKQAEIAKNVSSGFEERNANTEKQVKQITERLEVISTELARYEEERQNR